MPLYHEVRRSRLKGWLMELDSTIKQQCVKKKKGIKRTSFLRGLQHMLCCERNLEVILSVTTKCARNTRVLIRY